MKLFLAVLVLVGAVVSTLGGCAASTGDGSASPPDPKACEAQTPADGVAAIAAPCEAEPAEAPAPVPAAVVEKVGVRPAYDLDPDNTQ
jgi:hypothetical protein